MLSETPASGTNPSFYLPKQCFLKPSLVQIALRVAGEDQELKGEAAIAEV